MRWHVKVFGRKRLLINNANVLAMGEKVVSHAMGAEMAEKWLAGQWCEGFEPQRKANNRKGACPAKGNRRREL